MMTSNIDLSVGTSFFVRWGSNEVTYVFGVDHLSDVGPLLDELYHQMPDTRYFPFFCTHQHCPAPLGYLYEFSLSRWDVKGVDTEWWYKGEGSVPLETVDAGIFIPQGNRVTFERLRIRADLNAAGYIQRFVATSH